MQRLTITGKTDAGTGFTEDKYNHVSDELLKAIIFCKHGYNRQITIMGSGVNITVFSAVSMFTTPQGARKKGNNGTQAWQDHCNAAMRDLSFSS